MRLPFVSSSYGRGGAFAAAPAAPVATASTVTRQSDLVHWWKLDDTSDEIGDATLTHVNDASIQSSNALFGSAWEGDGTGDYSHAENSVTAIGSAITITFWARIESSANLESVLIITDDATTGDAYSTSGLAFLQTSGPVVKAYIRYGTKDGGTYTSVANASFGSISTSRWYFFAATWSESSDALKLYKADVSGSDGSSPDSETTLEATLNVTDGNQLRPSDSLVIGDHQWGELDGQVDDIRYYNVELSKSDIDAIYNGGSGDMS